MSWKARFWTAPSMWTSTSSGPVGAASSSGSLSKSAAEANTPSGNPKPRRQADQIGRVMDRLAR
jgi:hypothetical protein